MLKIRYLLIFVSLSCAVLFSCTKDVNHAPPANINLPQPIQGRNYSEDEVSAFKQLTFQATHQIIRLPAFVSIYLVDTTYPYLIKEVDSIIHELNALLDTNLVFARTTYRFGANIEVYLTDRDTYIRNEPQSGPALQNSAYTGYAYPDDVNSGIIKHCGILVDMQRTGSDTLQQRYILHHEMMHALGFMGHVTLPQIYTVMFAYALTPYVLDYAPFDKKMMQLLYNPAITPGMSEAKFDQVVQNL